uniref:Uncharacterized protein n=1 Tax=Rhizophora mucronata TaxID=61149 RepID=A0A2P2KN41_RHIMU
MNRIQKEKAREIQKKKRIFIFIFYLIFVLFKDVRLMTYRVWRPRKASEKEKGGSVLSVCACVVRWKA